MRQDSGGKGPAHRVSLREVIAGVKVCAVTGNVDGAHRAIRAQLHGLEERSSGQKRTCYCTQIHRKVKSSKIKFRKMRRCKA